MKHFCVVCGGSLDVPSIQPTSGVWSHTDPALCVTVLRAQRSTLHEEVAAWTKRAMQAEAEVRALRASVSGAPGLAPWYEEDGSTVMLPAEEVERRRRLAAKIIGAARRWCDAMRGSKSERAARGLKDRGTDLIRAVRALDAAAPSAPGVSAGGEGTGKGAPRSEEGKP